MATFDLGRVTPLYKRDYSASASYELNDVVLYNGNLYWHIQATATVGIPPTDTTVWKLAFSDEGVRAEIRGYADDAQTSKTAAAQSASQASASASSAQASASQAALSAQAAGTSEGNASASASAAATSATNSATSAQSAASSAQAATDKATLASQKAAAASESASLATAKASAAATSETNAAASAQTATAKASEAAASATSAQEYDESAQQSAVNAQTAQGLAETAQTGAETAQGLAEDARDLAQQYAESIDPEHIYSAFPTDTAEGSIASFADGADDIPLKSLVVNIDPVQSGSGDPSPDNVRPISGWTGMMVSRTGINQWDEEWEVGDIDRTTGQNSYATAQIRSKNYIPVLPSTQYYFAVLKSDGSAVAVCYYDSEKNFISYQWAINTVKTTPDNCHFIRFTSNRDYGATYNHDISINYPSSDHDYHPYTGQTIPISWQTEAGTVYGGSLDVLSGVLTNGWGRCDLGMLDWAYDSAYQRFLCNSFYALGPYQPANNDTVALMVCDKYATRTDNNTASASYNSSIGLSRTKVLHIRDTRYNDKDAFKASLSGTYLVFKLAEPTTIQLTPHEVRSLLGQNNIFADTGDCAVEYRADTKMYIERLTEPDADMIADSNIVSGQYFMVGNSLYLATSNIASGGQVIVGTNCTHKSLSEALNEINQ